MSRSILSALSRSTLLRASVLALMSGAALAEDAAGIQVSDAYARAVPPGQPNSAVFMTLTNPSQTTRALVSAASPAAETVELHTHTEEGGMMRMRRVERIELPGGASVELKPGGLHVMLIGLKGDLQPGANLDLSLNFDDGSKRQIKAQVRKVEAMQQHH